MNHNYAPLVLFLKSLHMFCVPSCSWHEMGTKDLPAVIDYILQTTGVDQIFYAGHSQGTTSFYVLCSERPEYNSKIRAMFSLAPVAFMSNVKSPLLRMIATMSDQLTVSCQLIFDYVITLFIHDTNKCIFNVSNKYNLKSLLHAFGLTPSSGSSTPRFKAC